jgi:flagellar biosynthesis component FlhA
MSATALPSDTPAKRTAEIGLALAVVFIIGLLVMPLPTVLLDLLLAVSIAASLVMLLVALSARDPLEFSSFPMMLLLVTLFP